MMKSGISPVYIAFALILAAVGLSVFTVDQRQYAIVFQMGEVVKVISDPGIKVKWPLIQNVRYFDKRILTLDTPDPDRFITSEKKNVLVDSFVKWKIVDPRLFYISVAGDETRALIRLSQTVNAGLREEFGKRTVHEVVSGERDRIMEDMRAKADMDAKKIGVQIIDVRVKRVEYANEISGSVYQRMEAERKRVANALRSEGAAEAEKIKADANKQREIIIAEAYRQAQEIMGDGDARATAIYASAFNRNPEFYAFYRSLEAYRSTFRGGKDFIIVEPNSDFFRYMRNLERGGGKNPQ
jgi:membrane protease subunit HflC